VLCAGGDCRAFGEVGHRRHLSFARGQSGNRRGDKGGEDGRENHDPGHGELLHVSGQNELDYVPMGYAIENRVELLRFSASRVFRLTSSLAK